MADTLSIPSYTGPHCVGVTDLETEIYPKGQTFGTFIHKGLAKEGGGVAGLALETSLFSLFYPAERGSGSKEKSVWFPR